MQEIATPTQTSKSVEYVCQDAVSCRIRYPNITLDMGSPDFTVSAKLAATER
jgi:hypothetical protein